MRAWRLRTREGQTLYATGVEELKGVVGGRRVDPAPASSQQTLPGRGFSVRALPGRTAEGQAESTGDPGDGFYGAFRRQLIDLLRVGPTG